MNWTAPIVPPKNSHEGAAPGIGGVEAAARIRDELPETVVFLCSTYQRADLPPGAVESGAAAYVHKEELRPELIVRLWEEAQPAQPVS